MLTMAFGIALTLACVVWAAREVKRETRVRRYALVSGPQAARPMRVVYAGVGLAMVVNGAVVLFELVPEGSFGWLALTIGWMSVTLTSFVIAASAVQRRKNALGWLTLTRENELRFDADGTSKTLRLQPGSVRVYPITGTSQFAQFVLHDGAETAAVWGMIGLPGMKEIAEAEPVMPDGLMIAGSAEQLRRWLAPFIDKAFVGTGAD